MMNARRYLSAFVIASAWLTACAPGRAQDKSPMAQPQQPATATQTGNGVPVYRIQVVGRDIPTINYWHRSGSTEIGFEGTSLLPQAKGSASVTSQQQTSVEAKFEGLVPANSFGEEYLTYVLWAITPQGRPMNLGEIIPNGTKAEVHVTTGLQQFALIVTAEPYFAVSMPSDLVVLQNTIKKNGTTGIIDTVDAHYNLLPRGAYVEATGQHTVLNPVKPSDKSPLQMYEAINAVQIAQAAGAEKYTPDILAKANQELANAQALDVKKSQRKEMITYARGAVQDAEDARVSTCARSKKRSSNRRRWRCSRRSRPRKRPSWPPSSKRRNGHRPMRRRPRPRQRRPKRRLKQNLQKPELPRLRQPNTLPSKRRSRQSKFAKSCARSSTMCCKRRRQRVG